MKKQKFKRKLSLNKATIANLNMDAMRRSRGRGLTYTTDLKDPVCLSTVECPVETDECLTPKTVLATCQATCQATCLVTCQLTCPVTCNPCDSVFIC